MLHCDAVSEDESKGGTRGHLRDLGVGCVGESTLVAAEVGVERGDTKGVDKLGGHVFLRTGIGHDVLVGGAGSRLGIAPQATTLSTGYMISPAHVP